jgi:hypothetical protein
MRRRFAPLLAGGSATLGLSLLLLLAGCEAGNRADPGSDNAQLSPTLVISTPYEGQQVVPEPAGAPVRALFDLQGGRLGRTAGSTVRWRLDRRKVPADGNPVLEPVTEWTILEDPARAVSLGTLGVAATPARVVNPAARVVRRFTVHAAWANGGKG